jgi:superfamily I DNA/RNA helicase
MYIGNGYGSLKEAETRGLGVQMTYQSSKGLDFENVYLPFLNQDLFITYNDARSRTIFMVAMSRSSKNLTMTYSGNLFHYVRNFKHQCIEIDANAPVNSDPSTDFDF